MSAVGVAVMGLVGAAIPEVMRAIAALRAGKAPTAKEVLASILSTLLGLGVLLWDLDDAPRLQIAVLGAAFPQLFSGLVAAAKPPEAGLRSNKTRSRSVWDYLAWRL
jgi:predicted membrane-bound spermidine synthase